MARSGSALMGLAACVLVFLSADIHAQDGARTGVTLSGVRQKELVVTTLTGEPRRLNDLLGEGGRSSWSSGRRGASRAGS
jgi:hypothetical protein